MFNNNEDKFKNINEFCSLVFACDCYIAAVLEAAEISDDAAAAATNKAAEYVLAHNSLTRNLEESRAQIYRKNPSCKYICIEKLNNNCVYNIYFESIKLISLFTILKNPLKFLTVLIYSNLIQLPIIFIIGLKDNETRKKCVRNIEFCYKDYITTHGKHNLLFNLIPNELFYYSVNLVLNTEINEIIRGVEIQPATRENKTFKLRKNISKNIELNLIYNNDFNFEFINCFGFLYQLPNSSEFKLFDDVLIFFISLSVFRSVPKKMAGFGAFVSNPTFGMIRRLSDFLIGLTTKVGCLRDLVTVDLGCAADFTARLIPSPIRIFFTLNLKFFPEGQKFWIRSFHKITHKFLICFGKTCFDEPGSFLISITLNEDFKNKFSLFDNNNIFDKSRQPILSNDGYEEYEVVLSGTYPYDPLMTEDVLEAWREAHRVWISSKEVPLNLQRLLKHGIPSDLRKTCWLMLVGIFDTLPFSQSQYNSYVEKDSAYEKIIQRDITRTFTCHEFFKLNNGPGQQQLYRICKAYSNYDLEVGYCQGMSFIVANILLHMDELSSFCLLVQLMFKLGHRTIFGQSFDELQSIIYTFKRLMQTHIPELFKHLSDLNIEPQMYIPQWFLTIFTSKFPLGMVDLCFDMFLSQGQRSMLQVALAMLMACWQELISMNFENTLKFICSNIPKIYCSPEAAREVFQIAYSLNFSTETFDQLQIEFDCYKKDIVKTLDPLEIKKIENRILIDSQMRLEVENGILANNLIQTKIECNARISDLEQRNHSLEEVVKTSLSQICELNNTISSIKESEASIKSELEKLQFETHEVIDKKNAIIEEYKNICSLMESRENETRNNVKDLSKLLKELSEKCANCNQFISKNTNKDFIPINKNSVSSSASNERVECLEMELALAKMKMAESEHQREHLQHQLMELQKQKNKRWFE